VWGVEGTGGRGAGVNFNTGQLTNRKLQKYKFFKKLCTMFNCFKLPSFGLIKKLLLKKNIMVPDSDPVSDYFLFRFQIWPKFRILTDPDPVPDPQHCWPETSSHPLATLPKYRWLLMVAVQPSGHLSHSRPSPLAIVHVH
jgi:hypothetical protein